MLLRFERRLGVNVALQIFIDIPDACATLREGCRMKLRRVNFAVQNLESFDGSQI